jgi:cytochrome c biogenesis protein CcmG/thiol:disulfide interchange protein DsbE
VDVFRRPAAIKAGLTALLLVIVGVGLWQARPGSSDDSLPTLAEQKEALAGAPPELAGLHRQASMLLDGSIQARLDQLRGYPVVVNKWASWCGPCRAELPVLGRTAAQTGTQVAFLGLNSEDPNRGSAGRLLDQFPQSYPSYRDPKGKQGAALGLGSNYPATLFIDAGGRTAYLHQGPYDSEAALKRDIERYLKVSL